MMKLMKHFLPKLSFILIALCIVLWVVAYCSFSTLHSSPQHNEAPKDEAVDKSFATTNQFYSYVHNLSRQLGKQNEQISILLSKLDELHKLQASSLAYNSIKLQNPREIAKRVIEEPEDELTDHKTKSGADILTGMSLNNEFEVIPFTRFTANRLYLVEPGLGRRVIEKPIGYKRRDLSEVVEFAVKELNGVNDSSTRTFTSADFLEGIYRTLPGFGTHYELYFKNIQQQKWSQYVKVVVTRILSEPYLFSQDSVEVKHKVLNLILPLSGRIESFKRFMDNFVRVCIRQDRNVYLTIVYFGREGFAQVQSIIKNISTNEGLNQIQVIFLEETFSRSKGLQVGVERWKMQSDVLMFMCDVDIVFNHDFLERCRLNAESGQKVYYPIVFSLYNPKIVYALQDEPLPQQKSELIISKETGFWRDFGYGMTCQYRKDFLKMKGFDELTSGWGMEDVYLYRKYVRSNIFVVRAADPGIFHIWHEKSCDPKLSPDRYHGCIRSKALNEASHSQLGILAFKDEINTHKALQSNKFL